MYMHRSACAPPELQGACMPELMRRTARATPLCGARLWAANPGPASRTERAISPTLSCQEILNLGIPLFASAPSALPLEGP